MQDLLEQLEVKDLLVQADLLDPEDHLDQEVQMATMVPLVGMDELV